MTQPPTPVPHDQPWPAAPHDQPRPAAPHDQPWAAAPHDQPWAAAPHDQPWAAAPHDQPWAAALRERPWSPAAGPPPPLPYDEDPRWAGDQNPRWAGDQNPRWAGDQDPRWAGQMPGPATTAYLVPPGTAVPNRFEPHPSGPLDFGPPGGLRDPRGRAPGRRKNRLLPAAAAVVALALLAGIAIIMTRHHGGTADQAVRSTPAGSGRTDSGAADRGGRKAAAQHRITTAMIFPNAHVIADGIKFGRVTAVLNKECRLTARGAFASALTSAGCMRVARATFVDNAKRYAVTAGVAELPSPAAASHVNRRKDLRRDVWFTGLDGPAHSGATAVSKSVGLGYDIVYGRYIVYSLATYSSGRNPAGHAAAVRTLKDLARSFAVMSRRPLTTQGK